MAVDRNEVVECIRASGIFDSKWYTTQYPDVNSLGFDPVEHFVNIGAALGRNPNANFNTRIYLKEHPDVARV